MVPSSDRFLHKYISYILYLIAVLILISQVCVAACIASSAFDDMESLPADSSSSEGSVRPSENKIVEGVETIAPR
jgi:hypothetical protein